MKSFYKSNGITIYNDDCLNCMAKLGSDSIDLICIDPPYNIGKAEWDKWKSVEAYVEFMGLVFAECERLLKDNGSFYFFHNDFLQIVKLQNWLNKNSKFVFKQLILWNKRFEGGDLKSYLDGYCSIDASRNYKQMAEYCLFYTFQDETGLSVISNDLELYRHIRDYFQDERKKIKHISYKKINEKCFATASNGGGMASNILTSYKDGWTFPTKEKYELLQNLDICKEPYEDLRQEYEDLRQEYEGLRYTFNNQKTHHSVWNYSIGEQNGHVTSKPIPLIENIIKHSSNESDLILDCFMGSGATLKAAKNLNRRVIGIDLDKDYCEIAAKGLEGYTAKETKNKIDIINKVLF